jgi:DNA repair exonuclease SbcCD nuclease subunit
MKIFFATDIHLSSTTPSSRLDDYPEAVFTKVEHLCQMVAQVDDGCVLVLGGDLFHKPNQPDWLKNRLIRLLRTYGVTCYSIRGNHDLLYGSNDLVEKTSYDNVVASGAIIDLMESGVVELPGGGGWRLVSHDYGESFPAGLDRKSIVVSHSFYNYSLNDRLSISKQDVVDSGAGYVFLGHDHKQYPIVDLEGCYVVRPGALTRGTSATENEERTVSFAILDTVTGP